MYRFSAREASQKERTRSTASAYWFLRKDTKTLKKIQAAMKSAAEEGISTKFNGKKPFEPAHASA
jgi:hypothetical protein